MPELDMEVAVKPFVDLMDELSLAFGGEEMIPQKIKDLISQIFDSYTDAIIDDRKETS